MHKCFPELIAAVLGEIGRDVADYERLHCHKMAEHEDFLRKKLNQSWRQI